VIVITYTPVEGFTTVLIKPASAAP
jgi:hypothetical protein